MRKYLATHLSQLQCVPRTKLSMYQLFNFQVVTEPRQMDSPIEQWIAICESKDKRSRADVGKFCQKISCSFPSDYILSWYDMFKSLP